MMLDTSIILANRTGLVVAPAGCGKTQLIVETLKQQPTGKPFLILTHTTAGIAALKARLTRNSVSPKSYHLATISGWAVSVLLKYPTLSGVNRAHLVNPDYTALHTSIAQLIANRHIDRIITATYARVLVDEYQDCTISQHNLVTQLSRLLPTIVLGDPMQAIFDFGADPLPSWTDIVQAQFPVIGQLNNPWRWSNSGCSSLGEWILGAREYLSSGQGINIKDGGPGVTWVPMSGNHQRDLPAQVKYQYSLRNRIPNKESILIIGNAKRPQVRHEFAQRTNGIGVVEPVDMKDITGIFTWIDKSTGETLVGKILDTASKLMTGVGKAVLLKRILTIEAGRGKKEPTAVELSAVAVKQSPTANNILALFQELKTSSETKVFRQTALSAIMEALRLCSTAQMTPIDAITRILEKRRHSGEKRIPTIAIGSTLLLKGLEADHVIILDGNCETMSAKNLYVALSRGAKSVTVFAANPVLGRGL
ncbi:UvrD-helicase domain-containing protein [Microbulbifer epialgicus]|uniref:DNA 3'-5' helicase II n=1 Tax=Microbulbifer epialgicus TaxID=393907 RepID=A0ABV4NXL0_9GAMM